MNDTKILDWLEVNDVQWSRREMDFPDDKPSSLRFFCGEKPREIKGESLRRSVDMAVFIKSMPE